MMVKKMNSDLSKELLRKINKSFTLSYQKSEKVRKLLSAIKKKDCDYLKAMEYAEEVGKILAEAYMKNLSSDELPDGKMYYDIASAILNPTLENNYGLISSYVCGAMDVMNEKAGINAKARKPSYNIDKTLGLIKKVSEAEYFDDVKKYLNEPVITNALSIVDEGARVNAELHYNMGHKPVIVRRASFKCCDWCSRLAGIREYSPTMNRDIFRRHQNCRCTVIYDPRNSDGKVQDVWTKEFISVQDVTSEYYKVNRKLNKKVILEEGLKINEHKNEIEVAEIVTNEFGGEITVLKENNQTKMPDYKWDDKLWDLKTCSSEKACDSAIRHGLKQILNNPGGIILDYRSFDANINKIKENIEKRMRHTTFQVDIMIIMSNEIFKIFRYKI
jgi:hypothetical protein